MTTRKSITVKPVLSKIIFLCLTTLCLTPIVSPPAALLMGILVAQFFDHPFPQASKKATHWLLKASVVGLGFGMNAGSAIQAGKEGLLFTVFSIVGTLTLAVFLGRLFKVEKVTSFLISGGTAICGGSAIAALSPVVKANQNQISVALGVIFILNSVALFIFPPIGHLLHLSQTDFGLWCAIAIHDTSSVVGAAAKYGQEALMVATTIKLARALWIIPVAFFSAIFFKNKDASIKIPYFIGLFILAVIVNTFVPGMNKLSPYMVKISMAGLALTLFLIGSSHSAKMVKSVGINPIIQGLLLWAVVSITMLIAIIFL